MNDPVSPGDQESPPVLDDLVEPLETPPLPAPIAAGTRITMPDATSLQILTLLKSGPQVNLYNATTHENGPTVWLHEALNEEASTRLRHEADVLEGLECPMFPHVLACFECDGKTYLATEPLTPETTLADLLAGGIQPLPHILSVLAQIAFGLIHLHAGGWAHLGLRPTAIALSKPVKILDLTYATRLGEPPATAFYHAGYSPPELLTGDPVDACADVYAVGALLYHAINGQPIAETGAELSTWQPPPALAGVPQILHRCLGSRETRYATMEELHRHLLRLARRYAPSVRYAVTAATTIGLEPSRTNNQDAYAYLTGCVAAEEDMKTWAVACVADGMGGLAAGEVASEVAVKTVMAEAAAAFAHLLAAGEHAQMVRQWIHTANGQVCAALEAQGARGGTTIVCACLVNRRLVIAHVGDCRLYLLRAGALQLCTRDHSLAMALALQGELALDGVRHHPDRSKVTRSLGDRQPLPDYFVDTLEQAIGSTTVELQGGDVLLLCSDGLWEPVLEDEMVGAVRQHAPDLHAAATALLAMALEREAPDNATVLLLRVEEVAAA
jgi:serine/threonine protein phosphatase PrpC